MFEFVLVARRRRHDEELLSLKSVLRKGVKVIGSSSCRAFIGCVKGIAVFFQEEAREGVNRL